MNHINFILDPPIKPEDDDEFRPGDDEEIRPGMKM
jgi:hypothetical protein